MQITWADNGLCRAPSHHSIPHPHLSATPRPSTPRPPHTFSMSANGDSVEAKLAELEVKDSGAAGEEEKDESTGA